MLFCSQNNCLRFSYLLHSWWAYPLIRRLVFHRRAMLEFVVSSHLRHSVTAGNVWGVLEWYWCNFVLSTSIMSNLPGPEICVVQSPLYIKLSTWCALPLRMRIVGKVRRSEKILVASAHRKTVVVSTQCSYLPQCSTCMHYAGSFCVFISAPPVLPVT